MTNNVLIAPSILSADFSQLGADLADIASADLVHVDVMDGSFVPAISFGQQILGVVKRCTSVPADVHLMVEHPETSYQSFLDAGADILTFHLEATRHARVIVEGVHKAGRKVGVALNPGTSVGALDALIEEVDLVLLLAVNPGLPGQKTMESTYGKLGALRELCEAHGVSPLVEVDGGVSAANAGRLCEAGATVLVAGSAVFGAADRTAAIDAIHQASRA